MTDLKWVKSLDNNWLDLGRLDLEAMSRNPSRPFGVYIIWHGGQGPRIVRIGKGDIAQRLLAHRQNPLITRFEKQGPLMVTWAVLHDPHRQAAIEKYLNGQFPPLVRDQLSDMAPERIRSPFA